MQISYRTYNSYHWSSYNITKENNEKIHNAISRDPSGKRYECAFGHTVGRTVCLFEILCAPKSVECAFFEIVRAPNQCNEMY